MYSFGKKMDKSQAKNVNPIVLAFVGDAVYSLFVRTDLTFISDGKSGELNKIATSKVKATAQAKFVSEIMPCFSEEELNVFKRARNAKKSTRAKSASVAEYNASTGFEAVLGYLYLIGDEERINYLLNKGTENES